MFLNMISFILDKGYQGGFHAEQWGLALKDAFFVLISGLTWPESWFDFYANFLCSFCRCSFLPTTIVKVGKLSLLVFPHP